MSKPDLLLGPFGSRWMDTLATTNKTHASEIQKLLDFNAELVAALEPFAKCCEHIKDEEDEEEWAKFFLLVKDYRRAKAALDKYKEYKDNTK